jgi:membrane protease subunit HflK
MPSNQSGGPWGSGSKPPDLEEFLRRSQDMLGGLRPGNLGGRGIALIALAAIALWGFSGFFRVEPDELGVVLRFGKFQREAQPGLNYHLPYPIETALTPQALRVNKIDIGFGGSTMRDEPEESLMLTGEALERDFFMTAETAKDFGLVDKVIDHRPEIPPLAVVS